MTAGVDNLIDNELELTRSAASTGADQRAEISAYAARARITQAHVVYQSDEVWANTDSSKCLYTYAEVSHGSRGGYAKSYGLSSSGIPLAQLCILVWSRPPGNLKSGWQYFYWDGAQ